MIGYYFQKFLKPIKIILIVLAVYVSVTGIFLHTFSKSSIKTASPDKLRRHNRTEVYKVINDKELNSTKEGRALVGVYRTILCSAAGEGCTDNPTDGDQNMQNSITGVVSRLIVLPLSNPPSSGVIWARDSLENTGFISKTYAAEGIGFSGLKPFGEIWSLFRNLSYLIMVLIVISIGFLIMFRRKVNAQTVVNLENALPRIVIAFLLITFSFPIAGFLIDLMYLSIFVIISFLGNNSLNPFEVDDVKRQVLNGGFSLWDRLFWNGVYWQVGDAILSILPAGVNVILRILVTWGTYFILSHLPGIKYIINGTILNGIATVNGLPAFIIHIIVTLLLLPVLFFIAPMLLSVVFFLTALFVFFRIFFILFKNYIMIVMLVIFAPIILLIDAIPGQKMFSKWLKLMLANLLSFPITIGLILLSNIVVNLPETIKLIRGSDTPVPFWTPPLLYSSYTEPNAFSILVGVGILFMIPNILKGLKGMLGLKDGLFSGVGLGLFFGGVGAISGAGMAGLGKFGQIGYGVQPLLRVDALRNSPLGKIFGGNSHPPHPSH